MEESKLKKIYLLSGELKKYILLENKKAAKEIFIEMSLIYKELTGKEIMNELKPEQISFYEKELGENFYKNNESEIEL